MFKPAFFIGRGNTFDSLFRRTVEFLPGPGLYRPGGGDLFKYSVRSM